MATSLLLAYFARERAATSVFDEEAPPAVEQPAPGAEGASEGAGGFQEVVPAPAEPEAAAPPGPAGEAPAPAPPP